MITVNKEKVLNTAKEILLIDSPSGFCYDVMDKIQSMTEELGRYIRSYGKIYF